MDDGTIAHYYTIARYYTSTTPPVSTLSDGDLDTTIAGTLEVFPQFGRLMLRSSLKAAGHCIPMARI